MPQAQRATAEPYALDGLEESIRRTVQTAAALRCERDAALSENKRLRAELEGLRGERKQVRVRIEKLLGRLDLLTTH